MTKVRLQLGAVLLLTSLIAAPFLPLVYADVDEGVEENAVTLKRKYGRPELTLPVYDDDGSDGSINLYRNVKDMVALSSYIYQHAAMIEEVHEVKSPWYKFWDSDRGENKALREDLSAGKTVGQVLRTCKDNLDVLDKKSRDVRDATKVIKNDFAEEDATDATKDTEILAIHAEDEDVKKSCVYAITVNPKLKRLSVVFRGTSNMGDWAKDVLVLQNKVENPVKSQKEVPKIGIHSGFANAILKDGKMDEILDEVKSHLQGLSGYRTRYRLFVTGHSLGGALATLFGFYAAANDDLMKLVYGPVSLFSVSSPRVGNSKFLEAHKELEHMGRLRHARTHNEQDKVSRVPYIGGGYKHVGLEIRLRPIRRKLGPILDYPAYTQWVQQGKSLLEAARSLPDALRLHGCELIRDRLKFSKKLLENTTLEREYRRLWGLEYATTFS